MRGRRIELPVVPVSYSPRCALYIRAVPLFSVLSPLIFRENPGRESASSRSARLARPRGSDETVRRSSVIYIQKSRAHKYCIFCKAHVRHTQIVISEFAASSQRYVGRRRDRRTTSHIWNDRFDGSSLYIFPFSRALFFFPSSRVRMKKAFVIVSFNH